MLRLLLVVACLAVSAATFQDTLANPDFSLFRLAVLSTYSSDEMPEITTAFFPTDEAFDSLPEGLVSWFFSHPDKLKALVDYHLVNQDSTVMVPGDLVWKTVETLEGSTMQGLMVEGKVCVAGPGHDLATGRNVAKVNQSNNGFFVTHSVLFPDSLVPCNGDQDCSTGTNCRWYSRPECPDNTDTHSSATMVKLYSTCTGLATCQSCSMTMGTTCDADAECCGEAQCGDQGCCAAIGTTCSTPGSDSTCCTGTCGTAGTCCIADQQPCRTSDECCNTPCVIGPTKNHRICWDGIVNSCVGAARDTRCRRPNPNGGDFLGFCTGPAGSTPSGLIAPDLCRIAEADCGGAWWAIHCYDNNDPGDDRNRICVGVGDCDI